MEKKYNKAKLFVTIKMTLEEQFGTKEKPVNPPKVVAENEKDPSILIDDNTKRHAMAILYKENEKTPFNLTAFKLNFEKTNSGMIAYLPKFDFPFDIFIDWEQAVQPNFFFNHPELPYFFYSFYHFDPPLTPLEKTIMSFDSCPNCDELTKKLEALAVQRILNDRNANNPHFGCIASSNDLILHLADIPDARMDSGTVQGASLGRWWRITTERTWMKVTTKCFVFDLVATWYGPIRHQAVQMKSLWPRGNDEKIVLDTWFAAPSWQSLSDWAGGESELEDTGLVSDGF